jgi:hypothetical protein
MASEAKPNTNPVSGDHVALGDYQKIISDLHSHLWTAKRFPHVEQFPVLKAFFGEGKKIIQGQCGRNFGKTEIILYIAWRYGLTHPNSEIYIICPEVKQAKKIYWFKRRIQNYGPRQYVANLFESKLRVEFTNGSTITLDGCENYDSLRGIKPDLVIYDEFQHHSHLFDEEVMQPNLASGKVSLVVMGTPPKRKCYYTEFRAAVLEKVKEGHPAYFYVELPTSANPVNSPDWLAEKKADLFRKGKKNVWYREYEGKLVFDTESAIFPMFSRETLCRSRQWLVDEIRTKGRKLKFYALFDPATASTFGALFFAHNPYTSEVYILDEIYEKIRPLMRSLVIWERSNAIKESFGVEPELWFNIYDEAEAWFENEVAGEMDNEVGQEYSLQPTHKLRKNKIDSEDGRPGESLIMSMMLSGKMYINEECTNLCDELENFVKDEKGDYPTDNDHLVDCLFYFTLSSGYTVKHDRDTEAEKAEEVKKRRRETTDEVLAECQAESDYAEGYEHDYYDDDGAGVIWN